MIPNIYFLPSEKWGIPIFPPKNPEVEKRTSETRTFHRSSFLPSLKVENLELQRCSFDHCAMDFAATGTFLALSTYTPVSEHKALKTGYPVIPKRKRVFQ